MANDSTNNLSTPPVKDSSIDQIPQEGVQIPEVYPELSKNVASYLDHLSKNDTAVKETNLVKKTFVDELKEFLDRVDTETQNTQSSADLKLANISSQLGEGAITFDKDKVVSDISSSLKTETAVSAEIEQIENKNDLIEKLSNNILNIINFNTVFNLYSQHFVKTIKSLIDANAEEFKKSIEEELDNIDKTLTAKIQNVDKAKDGNKTEIPEEPNPDDVPQPKDEKPKEDEEKEPKEDVEPPPPELHQEPIPEEEPPQVEEEPQEEAQQEEKPEEQKVETEEQKNKEKEEQKPSQPQQTTDQSQQPDSAQVENQQKEIELKRKKQLLEVDHNLSDVNMYLKRLIEKKDVVEKYTPREGEKEKDEKGKPKEKEEKDKDSKTSSGKSRVKSWVSTLAGLAGGLTFAKVLVKSGHVINNAVEFQSEYNRLSLMNEEQLREEAKQLEGQSLQDEVVDLSEEDNKELQELESQINDLNEQVTNLEQMADEGLKIIEENKDKLPSDIELPDYLKDDSEDSEESLETLLVELFDEEELAAAGLDSATVSSEETEWDLDKEVEEESKEETSEGAEQPDEEAPPTEEPVEEKPVEEESVEPTVEEPERQFTQLLTEDEMSELLSMELDDAIEFVKQINEQNNAIASDAVKRFIDAKALEAARNNDEFDPYQNIDIQKILSDTGVYNLTSSANINYWNFVIQNAKKKFDLIRQEINAEQQTEEESIKEPSETVSQQEPIGEQEPVVPEVELEVPEVPSVQEQKENDESETGIDVDGIVSILTEKERSDFEAFQTHNNEAIVDGLQEVVQDIANSHNDIVTTIVQDSNATTADVANDAHQLLETANDEKREVQEESLVVFTEAERLIQERLEEITEDARRSAEITTQNANDAIENANDDLTVATEISESSIEDAKKQLEAQRAEFIEVINKYKAALEEHDQEARGVILEIIDIANERIELLNKRIEEYEKGISTAEDILDEESKELIRKIFNYFDSIISIINEEIERVSADVKSRVEAELDSRQENIEKAASNFVPKDNAALMIDNAITEELDQVEEPLEEKPENVEVHQEVVVETNEPRFPSIDTDFIEAYTSSDISEEEMFSKISAYINDTITYAENIKALRDRMSEDAIMASFDKEMELVEKLKNKTVEVDAETLAHINEQLIVTHNALRKFLIDRGSKQKDHAKFDILANSDFDAAET